MKNNKELSRFELEMEGSIAYATYRLGGKILNIDYVFAPPELRGKGAAGKLMEEIMKHAKENNLRIFPICGYAKVWLKRHSVYDEMVLGSE